ncbi:hypothetical protein B0H10DRAFT_1941081 [Mycena sp. CBHHK59/15]|nr:hypothetical protein B0H10DRAFT_1941081 [Mycena sp. CBHHK59/15]
MEIVKNWSQQFFGKKSINQLNHVQLEAKLKALAHQLHLEQVKKNNYRRDLKQAWKQLYDYEQLFDCIAVNEVPGLSQLLSNAKKEGWSTTKTTGKAQLTVDEKYHPWNYTDLDKDLAILVYCTISTKSSGDT